MTRKEISYTIFYLLAFTIAVASGLSDGFRGTHTPPMAIGIELLALVTGILLLFFDLLSKEIPKTFRNFRIHFFGLGLNILVVVYVVCLAA